MIKWSITELISEKRLLKGREEFLLLLQHGSCQDPSVQDLMDDLYIIISFMSLSLLSLCYLRVVYGIADVINIILPGMSILFGHFL